MAKDALGNKLSSGDLVNYIGCGVGATPLIDYKISRVTEDKIELFDYTGYFLPSNFVLSSQSGESNNQNESKDSIKDIDLTNPNMKPFSEMSDEFKIALVTAYIRGENVQYLSLLDGKGWQNKISERSISFGCSTIYRVYNEELKNKRIDVENEIKEVRNHLSYLESKLKEL